MKRIFAAILFVLMAELGFAFSFTYDGLMYEADETTGTAVVTGVNIFTMTEHLIVLREFGNNGKNYPVVGIEARAFQNTFKLERIEIPITVLYIGEGAFQWCYNLKSVKMGNSVTSIGDRAFDSCRSLTDIELPESLISIGSYAFTGCERLSKIKIPDSVTSVGRYAFDGCTMLEDVVIGNSVTSIEDGTFRNCKIDKITIGNSVTKIGNLAFYGCKRLKSVAIPPSITEIDGTPFYGTSIIKYAIPEGFVWNGISVATKITYPKENTFVEDGRVFSTDKETIYFAPADEADYTILEGVKKIGPKAFALSSDLTKLRIPGSVVSIGAGAFENCTDLTQVSFEGTFSGNGVGLEIASGAFEGCSNLTALNVEDIGYLCSINLAGTSAHPFYASREYTQLFIKGEKVSSLKITAPVTTINSYTFSYIDSPLNIEIDDSVSKIDKSAFYDCEGLKSIVLGNSITSISDKAFYGCNNLRSIHIPNTVISIGDSAFESTSFESIDIPGSVISIGKGAFSYSRLKSIEIPSSVTSLGAEAFRYCRSLQKVIIGNSVPSIRNMTFQGCLELKNIELGSSVTSIESKAFENCSKLGSIIIPNSVKTIGANAFSGCTGLTRVVISNSVTYIANETFSDCSGLTDLILGNSINKIGENAFKNCNLLLSLTSLNPIPPDCFNDLGGVNLPPKLKTVYVPVGAKEEYKKYRPWKTYIIEEIIAEPKGETLKIKDSFINVSLQRPYQLPVNFVGWLCGSKYSEFGFDITLPQELSVTGVTLNDELKTAGFNLNTKGLGTSSVSVVCTGTGAKPSDITSGLVTLTVEVPLDVNDGDVQVGFSNNFLTIENGKVFNLSDSEATITLSHVTMADSVELDSTSLNMLPGASIQLTATVYPEDTVDKTVTWASDNEEVAVVSPEGLVTSVKAGEARITATCFKAVATCDVKVLGKENMVLTPGNGAFEGIYTGDGVALYQGDLILRKGTKGTINLNFDLELSHTPDLEWKIEEHPRVEYARITVDPENPLSATLEGLIGGITSYSIQTPGNNVLLTGKIYVIKEDAKDTLILEEDSVSIPVNKVVSTEVSATTRDLEQRPWAYNPSFHWETLDESIVKLEADESRYAYLYPIAIGECDIVVSAGDGNGYPKYIHVTVTPPIPDKIEFDVEDDGGFIDSFGDANIDLYVGDTYQLKLKKAPEGFVNPPIVQWEISKDYIDHDKNGLITIKGRPKGGTISIYAAARDVEDRSLGVVCIVHVKEGLPPSSTIILPREDITILKGQKVELTATIEPERKYYPEIIWKSSNDLIASVENGYVVGKALGTAKITASCGEVSAICEVTVKDGEIIIVNENQNPDIKDNNGIINGNDLYVYYGKTVKVKIEMPDDLTDTPEFKWSLGDGGSFVTLTDYSNTANFYGREIGETTYKVALKNSPDTLISGNLRVISPFNLNHSSLTLQQYTLPVALVAKFSKVSPDNPSLIWQSSSESVATVSAEGVVSPIGQGECIITATADDGSNLSVACSVKVTEPTGYGFDFVFGGNSYNKETLDLLVGDTYQFNLKPKSGYVLPREVNWSSSDPDVASVTDKGLVVALSSGETVIAASAIVGNQEVKVECTVQVALPPVKVESIVISPEECEIEVGDHFPLETKVLPENAAVKTLFWTSNAPSIVSVNEWAEISALSVGEAIITAHAKDGSRVSGSCYVKVVPTLAKGIEIETNGETSLRVSETLQLTAIVIPETTTNKTVEWKSNKPDVATVSESGVVTAISVGEAVITATSSAGQTAEIKITVIPTKVQSIDLNRYSAQIKVQEGFQLLATIQPATATDKTLIWTSSNPLTVSVDDEGNVLGLALGVSMITCKATDGSGVMKECRVEVTVTSTQGISVSADGPTNLKATETVQLTAKVLPETATDKSVRWQSANPDIAKVDGEGMVTAVSVGSVEITATNSGGQSASITITVEPTQVSRVTLDHSSVSMKATESLTLMASVKPETATDKRLEWSVDKESVATVNQNGTVKAVSPGVAVITVKAKDGSGAAAECIVTVNPMEVQRITINAQGPTTLKAAETVLLTATVLPETATDKTVVWSSSAPTVAGINENGLVTAYSVGEAVIQATSSSGLSDRITIKVMPTKVMSITLNHQSLTMRVTDQNKLSAVILPETATDKSVKWTSSNPEVVRVDKDGNVTAVHEGEAVINCTAEDGSGVTASCRVYVVNTEVESISVITEGNTRIKVTETLQLAAKVLPETSTDKTVTWSSDNSRVAIVDANGLVTAVSEGSAEIRATTSNGLWGSITITVIDTQVSSITLSESTVILRANEVFNLIVTILPATATNKNIIWTVDDATVAEVGQDGLITAKSVGETVVTASTTDGSGLTANCRVTVIPTPATSITLTVHGEIDLEINETVQLTAEVLPETATDKTVVWTSSNPSVATVTETGLVTAVSGGETVITAMNSAGQYDRVTVTVYSTEMPDSGLDYIYDEDFDIVDGDIEGEILGIYTVEGQYLGTLYHNLAPGIYVVRTTKGSYKVIKTL